MGRRVLVGIAAIMLVALRLAAQEEKPKSPPADDYSGMYSFLQDGEFVQLTIEPDGRVTGFVSRYGELESDKGAFLNQFFKEAKLEGQNLSYTTETVHGTWYDFAGRVERGEAKTRQDDGYYVMRGTLTQHDLDVNKKVTSKSKSVVFKLFPSGTENDGANRN